MDKDEVNEFDESSEQLTEEEQFSQLCEIDEFKSFINNEFDKIVIEATLEERAEFAFGSIYDTMEKYKEEHEVDYEKED